MRASFIVFLILLFAACHRAASERTLPAPGADAAPLAAYSTGTKVVLQSRYGKTVGLSDSSGSWMDNHIIARLPNGTSGRILDSTTFRFDSGQVLLRYKVVATYEGKEYVGWVGKLDVQGVE